MQNKRKFCENTFKKEKRNIIRQKPEIYLKLKKNKRNCVKMKEIKRNYIKLQKTFHINSSKFFFLKYEEFPEEFQTISKRIFMENFLFIKI